MRGTFLSALVVAGTLTVSPAFAQAPFAPDLSKLSLEELLEAEIVSSASKFAQPVTDAPSSITVITQEEIHRFGHRTLADVLRTVRGFYTTYDRNYAYVGVRGFSRPGDYNTRILLLIDGHRVNDPIFDMASIGTDFPLDLSLVERIEVVRGPGSSLYGTNAFFGVINVITRAPRDLRGVRASASIGSQATRGGAATIGQTIGKVDLMVSASGFRTDGERALYFPEFDSPLTFGGVARDLDSDDAGRLFASASIGKVAIRALHATRDKMVPTAAFDSIFGDSRLTTRDQATSVDASYRGTIGETWTALARAGYDRFRYKGLYPLDYGDGVGDVLFEDGALSSSLTGEVTLNRRVRRHLVTVGSEVRRFLQAQQTTEDHVYPRFDDRHQSTLFGAYVQDEFTVIPSGLTLTAGVRVDRHDAYGTEATPRLGLVYRPADRTSLKLLYGGAFRAPNYYERFYYAAMRDNGLTLEPEQIRSTEAVWEQYTGKYLRTSVSVYHASLTNLISQRTGDETDDPNMLGALFFANSERSRSVGIEAEIEGRWSNGLALRGSHAFSSTTDQITGQRLSNSPTRLVTGAATLPLPRRTAHLAVEGLYVGERLTLDGAAVDGFFVQNVNVTFDRLRKVDVSLGVRNLFDASYADPGAAEHVQPMIRQDGRTLSLTLGVRF